MEQNSPHAKCVHKGQRIVGIRASNVSTGNTGKKGRSEADGANSKTNTRSVRERRVLNAREERVWKGVGGIGGRKEANA